MKLFVYLFLIKTLTGLSASMNPSIINGEEASENQFPHQVGLYVDADYFIKFICGGSLISPTFVITAAHCVDSKYPDEVFVLLGSIYLEEGIRSDARNFIVHPEWGVFGEEIITTRDDIALIEIDYVNYSDSVMNVALPDMYEYYPDYEASVVITSGWGRTNYTVVQASPTLLHTALLIIRDEVCMKILEFGNFFVEDYVCAASPTESGVCRGDSGGPLLHSDSMVLIGVTHAIPRSTNCTGFYVSVFTRVTYHRRWIWEMTGI